MSKRIDSKRIREIQERAARDLREERSRGILGEIARLIDGKYNTGPDDPVEREIYRAEKDRLRGK